MSDRRLASLDFLRGMAAFSVAIPHFFIFQHIGDRLAETVSILGVEIFFVLSGFVLAPQIVGFVVERPNTRNLGIFLVRRWMRTIPAYLIALAMISTVNHELLSGDFFRYAVYVQNLLRQSNASDYFSIAWSLSVEEWFYVLFPPFFMAVAWMTGRRSSSAVIAGVAFVLLITTARSVYGDNSQWGSEVRRVVAFRLDSIAWGFLLNLAVTRTALLERVTTAMASLAFAIVLAALIGLTVVLADTSNDLIKHGFPFYAAAFGAAAIILALKLDNIFRRSPRLSKAGEFMGRISYSTYLFHLVVLFALISLAGSHGWPFLLAVYLASTIAIAALMYTAVEAPILAMRPSFETSVKQAPHGLKTLSST